MLIILHKKKGRLTRDDPSDFFNLLRSFEDGTQITT